MHVRCTRSAYSAAMTRRFGTLRRLPSGRWQASYTGPDRHRPPRPRQRPGESLQRNKPARRLRLHRRLLPRSQPRIRRNRPPLHVHQLMRQRAPALRGRQPTIHRHHPARPDHTTALRARQHGLLQHPRRLDVEAHRSAHASTLGGATDDPLGAVGRRRASRGSSRRRQPWSVLGPAVAVREQVCHVSGRRTPSHAVTRPAQPNAERRRPSTVA